MSLMESNFLTETGNKIIYALNNASSEGSFNYQDMIKYADSETINGVAVSREASGSNLSLMIFVEGKPYNLLISCEKELFRPAGMSDCPEDFCSYDLFSVEKEKFSENFKFLCEIGQEYSTRLKEVNRRLWQEICNGNELKQKNYRIMQESGIIARYSMEVIWKLDSQLNLSYVSPSVKNLLGFSAEEVIDLGLEKVITFKSFEYAMQIFVKELLRKSDDSETNCSSDPIKLEFIYKDGSVVPTENYVTYLHDSEGYMEGVVCVTRVIA